MQATTTLNSVIPAKLVLAKAGSGNPQTTEYRIRPVLDLIGYPA